MIYSNGYCCVLIVVQRIGNVVPLNPLFNKAVPDTPVIDAVISGVAVIEFNSALACSPDTVAEGVKIRRPENGAPENGARPSIKIL
jgi:hypothetical protein